MLEELIILELKFGTKRKNRENFVRSLGPRGLNQIIVGTDRRHVLRTFDGMSHEITYTGPFKYSLEVSGYTPMYNPLGLPLIKYFEMGLVKQQCIKALLFECLILC